MRQCMKYRWIIYVSVLFSFIGAAQVAELSQQHAVLTKDCKSIRGHTGRVIAEADEPELNRDVALAHAREVIKSVLSLEKRLAATKKLLTPEQLKKVSGHYSFLEKTCAKLKDLSAQLEKELSKENPSRAAVKRLAAVLRTEITEGNKEHQLLKKKLDI